MKKRRGNLMHGVGERLRRFRLHLGCTYREMANKLNLHPNSYTRNESDTCMPAPPSLYVLQKEYGVSMDWLLFGKGPMFFKERQAAEAELAGSENKSEVEALSPEMKELFTAMDQDPMLRHEIFLHFYRYKDPAAQGADEGQTDPVT